jgi:hypothetical protein
MFSMLIWSQHYCDVSQSMPSLSPTSPSFAPWTLTDDGWVIDDQSQLLIWVPPDLRDTLLRPRGILRISTDGSVQLDLANAKLGLSWTECYFPM